MMLSIFQSADGMAVVEDPYICDKYIKTDPMCAQQHRGLSGQVDG